MSDVLVLDDYPRRDADLPGFLAELGLPGIVDIHVHGLPPRLQRAVWRFFDRLDDPAWPIRYRLDAEAQLAALAAMGVEAHTALAYAHQPGMLDWLNDYTLDLSERHPQVIPTFTIYPQEDVAAATEAAIGRGGAVVKVHLQVGRFHATDPRLHDAWHQISAARLPVVVHASAVYGVDGGDEYCGADGIRVLLEHHPDLTLVIAHLGMPQHDGFLALAEQAPNVHLDVAMTLVGGVFDRVVDDALLERVAALHPQLLFGSDYPSIPHDYVAQVRALASLRFTVPQLRDVLAGNARALLDQRRVR